MNDSERAKILAEIIEMTQEYPRKEEDEITLAEYAVATGISRNSARSRLDKCVKSGMLTSRLALDGGKIVRVYRKVGE